VPDQLIDEGVVRLAIAFGIGLLVGAERERRMAARERRGLGGIRTFALAALLGGVVEQIGEPALLAAAFAFVAGAALLGYFREGDIGLTTEMALVVTFMLGVLAQREPALASGLAVGVTIVLATRTTIHRFVDTVLTEQEVHDALLLAAAVLVVLPLLPDEAIDPLEVLNPFRVWRLVVLLMGISSAGYLAVRAIGPRYGLAVAGLLGGFVSSTVTIGAMGARSKERSEALGAAVSGALFSTVATIAQMAAVLAAVSIETLRELALPLICAGIVAVGFASFSLWRAEEGRARSEAVGYGRAFNLRPAVLLALTVTVVTVAAAIGSELAGDRGVLVAALIGGFPDTHAAGIGVASVVAAERMDAAAAVVPVLAALSSNTISKLVFASMSGGRQFSVPVGVGLVAVIVAAWVGALLPAV